MEVHAGLPQLDGGVYLADGGMETDLIFRRGLDLPLFASFVLLDDPETEEVVRDYFRDYLTIAAETGHGLVLERRRGEQVTTGRRSWATTRPASPM